MFAITPQRRYDEYDRLLRLLDELSNPWGSPVPYGEGALANARGRLGDSEIHNTDKEFRIRMDLGNYAPEEVKITSDNDRIIVHAKHEEKQDNHGFVSREMCRKYKLPKECDPKSVISTMNSHGILNIKVAKKAIEPPKETAIPVEYKE
ncbi:unnamed protein product [Candidula unifasciata]|uniref:SHSP domain-containing protein n=1 Tax=Candidula unifasciata TaxID=100452 RepID=A0A8S3YM32_9EUPU|nr:unnamed protein product [Candidula unifasciata]